MGVFELRGSTFGPTMPPEFSPGCMAGLANLGPTESATSTADRFQLACGSENEPNHRRTTLWGMAVTEQELLGEITDVLVWLTRGETLLVRCLREIRLDVQSVEARTAGFAPLINPPVISPPALSPPTNATTPTSAKADIELVPTLQVLFEPPSVEPVDLPAQEMPSPGAKRDYDFFAELDRKLARLTVADQGPHDNN